MSFLTILVTVYNVFRSSKKYSTVSTFNKIKLNFLNKFLNLKTFKKYSNFSELVSDRTRTVSYFNKTLRSKFSKTNQQKFKMYSHLYRTYLVLSEYNFKISIE